MHFYQNDEYHVYLGDKLYTDKSDRPYFSIVDAGDKITFTNNVKLYTICNNIIWRTQNYNTSLHLIVEPGYINMVGGVLVYPNKFIDMIYNKGRIHNHDNIVNVYSNGWLYILDMDNILTKYEPRLHGFNRKNSFIFTHKILHINNKIHFILDDGVYGVNIYDPDGPKSLDKAFDTRDCIVFSTTTYLRGNVLCFRDKFIDIIGYTVYQNSIIIATNEEYYSCIFGAFMVPLTNVPYIANWLHTHQVKSAKKI